MTKREEIKAINEKARAKKQAARQAAQTARQTVRQTAKGVRQTNRANAKAKAVNALTNLGMRVLKSGAKVKEDSLPGETHGILQMPDGSYERAAYMGPGTNIVRRLKRGDKGKTAVDKIAKRHDLDYSLATTPQDVRDADNRMVSAVKAVEKRKGDQAWNLRQGKLMIPKILAEKVTGKTFFNDLKGPRNEAEKNLFQNAIKRM